MAKSRPAAAAVGGRGSAAKSAGATTAAAAASSASTSRAIMLLGVVGALLVAIALGRSSLLSPSSAPATGSTAGVVGSSSTLQAAPPNWGTYRPGLYLGVRGTWPSSPLFGWAWSCATPGTPGCGAMDQIQSLRHDAEERDGVSKYGWLKHNGGDFGVQGVLDRKMGVNFTTSFVQPRKTSAAADDGDGGSAASLTDRWAMRIEAHAVGATPADDPAALHASRPQTVSLFFYTALADPSHSVEILSPHGKKGLADPTGGQVVQKLYAGPEAGEIVVRSGVATGGPAPKVQTYFHAAHIDESPPPPQRRGQPPPPPQQHTWAAKENLQRVLSESYRPRWSAHSARVQAAHKAHQEKHKPSAANQYRIPQFVAPPEAHFVPTLPNIVEPRANFLVVQHVITLPFTMDFVLQPAAEDERLHSKPALAEGAEDVAAELGRTDRWFVGEGTTKPRSLAQTLKARAVEFDERFARTFRIAPPAASSPSAQVQREFSQALLSNLLGGIGYFHGRQLVETSPAVLGRNGAVVTPARVMETAASELLSCVPSRSFFPRGFMWDEGFHQLLVSRWNLRLSLRTLESWFGQIRLDSLPVGGWMPREQILGPEARRRVPEEFRAQKPDVANPPTMLLALERILRRLREREAGAKKSVNGGGSGGPDELRLFTRFLVRWLPTLHTHVSWFFRTQASVSSGALPQDLGSIDLRTGAEPEPMSRAALPRAFRWKGRTLGHCLASGLDDYPRAGWIPSLSRDKNAITSGAATVSEARAAQLESDRVAGREELVESVGAEGHVDLHAWMTLLAETMAGLMEYAAEHAEAASGPEGDASSPPPSESVDYARVALSYRSYASRLRSSLFSLYWDSSSSSFSDWAYRGGVRRFLPHRGYVSLMPLFIGVIPPGAPELLGVLRALHGDKWGLLSPGGLRSLSKRDKLFGSGEDYWRGHVWINMQFLAVDALTRYGRDERASDEVRQLAGELAQKLRRAVSGNVMKEYERTGFVWEQYHALDGSGRKSHPFTGWTALTLLIMDDQ